MKTLSLQSAMIILLAVIVWLGYYLLFPDYPLRAKETVVVVFLCSLFVLGGQWLWRYFRKSRKKE